MRNYAVIVSHIVDDFIWNVYEKSTDQVIDSFYFKDEALALARFLENGGAFDGFTPSFVLREIPDPNVNAKFQQLMV